ncbi:glycoside hydrolase family 32 protein [Algoriphagus namhaensis]|uniref:Glycoside hydrolase family 32 protein n=1 Tax=Algoriphagus namhaensis TaxID=915353 RepID=A0ABV8AV33_9BACT
MNFKFSQIVVLILSVVLLSCQKGENITFENPTGEKYRPEYHFTPPTGWMNDPNGMFFLDGTYHLFYQHYPDSTVWGPMHWGHATSTDMLTWEHQPIAIYPDSLGYIFSGSAVLDIENSSELGTIENPPLVAIFTYHDPVGEKTTSTTFQTQGIAYSLDKGKSWEKYSGNPVLPNPGIRDFRDPKVAKIQNSDGMASWVMTLAVKDEIHFYSSPDLINWTLLSTFGKTLGAHGGVWECPDLLPFTAPDGQQKWVLLVSINPGGPQQGSATQYFIGNFENGVFTPDDEMIRWLDYGPDNYAGVTWSNIPDADGRTLFIGWMSNWLYSQVVPTESWRSAMTIPRDLSLFDVNGTLLLKSGPVKEMESLRIETFEIGKNSSLPGHAFEFSADIDSDNFAFKILNESGEEILFSKENGLITIDRRNAGPNDFHPDFAAAHAAPMSWKAEKVRLFVDAHSVELFINEGEIVMTSTVFPENPFTKIESTSGLNDEKIFKLKKVMN